MTWTDTELERQEAESDQKWGKPHPATRPEPVATLRDQFAMAALSGMLARPDASETMYAADAVDAYGAADAMLRARERPPTQKDS